VISNKKVQDKYSSFAVFSNAAGLTVIFVIEDLMRLENVMQIKCETLGRKMRFEVLTATSMRMALFWDDTPCGLV
jgi:hypothetical protein